MIRGLIEMARDLDLRGGECWEVQVCDEQVGHQQSIELNAFMHKWGYALDGVTRDDLGNYIETAWLTVVHEDGALLVPLEPAALSIPPF